MLWKSTNIAWLPDPSPAQVALWEGRGLSAEEAGFAARKLARRKGGELRIMTTCVLTMIDRLMGPVRNDSFRLLTVYCADPGKTPKFTCCDGYGSAYVPFDPSPFFELDDIGRKEMAVDILERGFRVVEEAGAADAAPALRACRLVREAAYENRWVWKRARSPERLMAEVVVESDTEHLVISLSVYDGSGQMIRRGIPVSIGADAGGAKWEYLGSLSWEGPRAVLAGESGFRYELDVAAPGGGAPVYDLVPFKRVGAVRFGGIPLSAPGWVGRLPRKCEMGEGFTVRQEFEGVAIGYGPDGCRAVEFGVGADVRYRGRHLLGVPLDELRPSLGRTVVRDGLLLSGEVGVAIGFDGQGLSASVTVCGRDAWELTFPDIPAAPQSA